MGSPPPAPKPPAPTDAAASASAQMAGAAKRKGFSNTFLSGPGGVTNQDSVRKTLLGG